MISTMTHRRGGFGLPAVIAIWATGVSISHAQGLGVITGNITDGSGTAVPRAKVIAAEEGTGFERTVFTNEAGHYALPSLRPTAYAVSVEAPNFRKFIQTGFTLLADQTATLDVQLELGATMQTVTV